MSSIITRNPSKSLTRTLFLSASKPLHRHFCTATATTGTRTHKLDRIADQLLELTKFERYDYSILFRHKLGLNKYGPAISGLESSSASSAGSASPETKVAEKMAFDIKLERIDVAAKIKIIKEVRAFTDYGLKEAKELMEKAPVMLKKWVTKEEGKSIVEKLKELGATVVLE